MAGSKVAALLGDLTFALLIYYLPACVSPADQTEVPPPPDKMAPPPKILIQEQICSEICQSKPSLSGLVEVPPPSRVYAGGSCARLSPEPTGEQPLPVGFTRAGDTMFLSSSVCFCVSGVTMTTVLLLVALIFVLAALNSG